MININLLPKEMRKSTRPDFWRFAAIGVAAATAVTVGVLHFSVTGTLRGLNGDIAEAQGEIDLLRPRVNERNELRARKAELESVTSVAETLRAGQTSWSGDLARFVRQLPTSNAPVLALNNLTMSTLDGATASAPNVNYDGKLISKEVRLQGRARSSEGVVQLLNTFEQSPDFGVQFQSAQRDEESGDFVFSATVGLVKSEPVAASQPTTPPTAPDGTTPPADPNTPTGTVPPAAPAASVSSGGTR